MCVDGDKTELLSQVETKARDETEPGVKIKPKTGIMKRASRCTNVETQ